MSRKNSRPKKTATAAPAPGGAASPPSRWLTGAICVLLVAMVFIVYGQTLHFDFVNYDDDSNVYQAPQVTAGLTVAGIEWAFTHTQLGRWAPMATLSRMIDCQVHHLWAGGHHLTNVLLHAMAAVALFLALLELTGFAWRSGFVAAVFALHPLHVEAVAWVSARGELLCGLFFMLAVWSYAAYAHRPGRWGCYTLCLLCFALGLMSKPTMVTLPFVLLLLDYWPLRRFGNVPAARLLKEKAPFMLGAVCFCAFTLYVTPPTLSVDNLPLWLRLENALVSCCIYLGQTFWPVNLAGYYPDPTHGFPLWQVAGSLLLLCGITAVAIRCRNSQPSLLVGWLWYLGILLPVIGVVQISHYAHADRYTYLPQIGLCVAITWAVAGWAGGQWLRRQIVAAIAVAIPCALLVMADRQATYWRNGQTLWTHTLDCTRDNDVAENDFGNVLLAQGRNDEALAHYREAVRINPHYADALANYGHMLFTTGQADAGIAESAEAVRLYPGSARIRCSYATDLFRAGHVDEAAAQFRDALQDDPDDADAYICLGNVMLSQGRPEDAIAQYEEALRADPDNALAHDNLCHVLVLLFQRGHQREAIADTQKALQLHPADSTLQYALSHMNAALP